MTSLHAPSRIVIAGVGLLSPLGHSAWQTYRALLDGRTLADRAAALPDNLPPTDLVRALGCVSLTPHSSDDPAVELAERAGMEALMEANIAPRDAVGFLGTSKGAVAGPGSGVWGLRSGTSKQISGKPGPRTPNPEPFALGPHGYLAARLQQRLGLPVISHQVAACASSLTALHHGRLQLLENPQMPDYALVITAEAALTPLFVHSYQRLGVLARLMPGAYRGLPLDERRRGFMLAELGAAVLLRRVDRVEPGQIELLDTAVASESYDLVRSPPVMPVLERLACHLMAERQIDMIHPHATGTLDHDAAELAAYRKAFLHLPHPPDVYACKGAVGHGLGAAGLVSLVLACLISRAGGRPPMPWLRQPINVPHLHLAAQPSSRRAQSHAVFAAGFGGHLAGAVIARI